MARLMIDTQTLIWSAQEPQKLSASAISHLKSADELLLSHASIWEMAVKVKTGKLDLRFPLEEFVHMAVQKQRLILLPISLAHIYNTQQLSTHHRDPFDRLLIAQASTENFSVISSNAAWDAYGINRIWS